jgi:hypothetical protein
VLSGNWIARAFSAFVEHAGTFKKGLSISHLTPRRGEIASRSAIKCVDSVGRRRHQIFDTRFAGAENSFILRCRPRQDLIRGRAIRSWKAASARRGHAAGGRGWAELAGTALAPGRRTSPRRLSHGQRPRKHRWRFCRVVTVYRVLRAGILTLCFALIIWASLSGKFDGVQVIEGAGRC